MLVDRGSYPPPSFYYHPVHGSLDPTLLRDPRNFTIVGRFTRPRIFPVLFSLITMVEGPNVYTPD
jgi:hypothetical protein